VVNAPNPPSVRKSRSVWSFAAPWGAQGFVTDLDGPVHWIEFEGSGAPAPETGPDAAPIVFVHGLGGSHLNCCLIGPQLAAGRRAVALDLHGFGLTPGTRADSTVQRNTRLLDRFVREVVGRPVILAGNSMGGLISILQASAAPEMVRGLVLLDPALPLPARKPDRQVASQFLQGAQVGKTALSALIDDGVFIDPACARRIRPDDGMYARRQTTRDLLHVLENARARPIQIGSVLKDDEDVGVTKHGLRAHGFHVRCGEKCRDNGIRNLVFDDVRRMAGPTCQRC